MLARGENNRQCLLGTKKCPRIRHNVPRFQKQSPRDSVNRHRVNVAHSTSQTRKALAVAPLLREP